MESFLWFAVGVVVEAIIASIYEAIISTRGTLRIDHSNPEKDLYRFEIDNLDKLGKKRYVNLKIDHNADLSQN